jgi:adenylate cyclase
MKRRGVHRVPPFLVARVALLIGLGLTLSSFAVLAYTSDVLAGLEGKTVDARFSIRGERTPPDDLVVVKIDDVTFDELGPEYPLPRTLHARAIDRIAADRPRVIAYDVQFSEDGPTQAGDLALAEATLNARKRVVLSTTEVNEKGEGAFLGAPDEVLREDLGGRLGNGLLPNDPDDAIRRVLYSVDGLESLAVAATEVAEGSQVDRRDFDDDGAWIDYYGPSHTIAGVSFSRVAQGKVEKGFFTDKGGRGRRHRPLAPGSASHLELGG